VYITWRIVSGEEETDLPTPKAITRLQLENKVHQPFERFKEAHVLSWGVGAAVAKEFSSTNTPLEIVE